MMFLQSQDPGSESHLSISDYPTQEYYYNILKKEVFKYSEVFKKEEVPSPNYHEAITKL